MSKAKSSAPSIPGRGVAVPEAKVQAKAIAMLEGFGCVVHRRNTGAFTAEHKGKSRLVRFSDKGSADVWCVRPNGMHLELEIKRLGERPSLDQVNWLIAHNGIGGAAAFWVDSTDILARVYRHIEAGGRIVYLDTTRHYRVKHRGKSVKVLGISGDYDLA